MYYWELRSWEWGCITGNWDHGPGVVGVDGICRNR